MTAVSTLAKSLALMAVFFFVAMIFVLGFDRFGRDAGLWGNDCELVPVTDSNPPEVFEYRCE